MAFEPVAKNTSTEALAELRGAFDSGDEITSLEDRLHAHAFAQQCAQEWAEMARLDRTQHLATEVLEIVASTTAGALSTWKSGMVPLGALANYALGGGSKVGSFVNPENRALRVACRAGKVLFHAQLAITTRNLILENP
jgi:hypothetical protein